MTHDVAPKCTLYCFLTGKGGRGVIMVPGWPPVAWGRGCFLIGNSDKPLPEGEEGVVEEGRGLALDHLSPRGLVGFLHSLSLRVEPLALLR